MPHILPVNKFELLGNGPGASPRDVGVGVGVNAHQRFAALQGFAPAARGHRPARHRSRGEIGCILARSEQCRQKFADCLKSLIAGFGHGFADDAVDASRQARVAGRDRKRLLSDDLLDDFEIGGSGEGPMAGQQLIQHHPGSKNVGACVDNQALDLLGGHVFQRADHRALFARGVASVLDTGHSEIGQFDSPAFFNQQVCRLHVAVNHVLAVRTAQRGQQVFHDGQRLRQRIAFAVVEEVLEVFAVDQFHHQKGDIAVTARVVNADDVGVLQPPGRARLVAKPQLVVGSGGYRELIHADGLDCHLPVETRIATFVNQSHRTVAKDADQLVATQFFKAHIR